MVKQVLLGILFFVFGAAIALGLFFRKNHSVPQSVITIGKKEPNFEPTKFSLDEAPSDSIRGNITNLSGDIWYQSRTATEPAQLTEGIPVQQGETWIASDAGKLTVNFNPALTLSLFPKTHVEIIQALPVNLVFKHDQGVGQYQVSGANPVTVRSLNLIANVNEGLFVIDTDPETGTIILSLKTGSAKIGYNSASFDSKVWSLEPGDVFTYNSNTRKGYFKDR